MNKEVVESFVELGAILRQFVENEEIKKGGEVVEGNEFRLILEKAEMENSWFTRENLLKCLGYWGEKLSEENLNRWLSPYERAKIEPKTVGIIMAGNIPLVGFHDFLSVLIAGNKAKVKLSGNDRVLLPFLTKKLVEINGYFRDKIEFCDERMSGMEMVIATGSNNSARYFEYYFGKYPHIIRKSRTSVAVLKGDESEEELEGLAHDIFAYFGLGCRSVSKVFVPKDFDLNRIFKAVYPYNRLMENAKYANNYDYNKAVYLMSLEKLLENGFLMLKEDAGYKSPIATLFYERYDDLEAVRERLKADQEEIQCVIGRGVVDGEVAFGKGQFPELWDYADGCDTMRWMASA